MIKQFAFLAITLSLLLAACAPPLSPGDILATAEILQALTALAETGAAPAATLGSSAEPATAEPPTAEPPALTETPSGPEVVFIDIFGDAEAQLQTKVVAPYIMYYRDMPEHPRLVSIMLEVQADVAGYPYKAEAIFEGGITNGWLISVSGGNVDWWLPECMVACTFSDAFRAAYPEIVAAVGG